ncbi:coiled-coil domain-containing protein [Streptomyces sp. NPDC015414]|uniref:coiled-coil domain-containing protein n=1 Tax=Streptomyces sp. NPDC015414 TaxID=3364957 RepID=UPI0037029A9A
MDAQSYNATLAELRAVRDEIKKARKELTRLEADRDQKIGRLAAYAKAKAERIAPAAGLSVADIVDLVPALAPDSLAENATPAAPPTQTTIAAPGHAEPEPTWQPAAAAPSTCTAEPPQTTASSTPAAAPAAIDAPRALPSVPAGETGDAWFTHTQGLASTRPNFTQQARSTVFLDTTTGVLVHRQQTHHLDLGNATAADILAAVFHTIPDGVERIYITAGDPWHRDADRYPYLRDAVAAWLNTPIPGWCTDTGRGRDRMAGHFVHARNPVGRYQRDSGDHHVEIRSVGEWFDLDGDDPHTVRDAFVLLWQALRRHWSDAVIMGSPSQTGRDLWTRTIPQRGQYADGFAVLSEELRGLLHATAGQGRNELITPPRIPDQLPQLVEYDRTFAYAKHTWKSPVGTPRRITAATFASWSQKEQMRALYGCGHWQIRVTVPDTWNHVGLLPAPAPGDRAWHYPAEPGTSFTTWAGGPEIHTALTNPLTPWKIEILDGILWEDGKPLDDWAKKLKETWTNLTAQAHFQGDPQQARAAHLASRAVRSILLYGIGAFAQRPRMVTGTTPRSMERDVPADAEIIAFDDQTITWHKPTGFSRDPNAHPEWAAAIWSAARAALLTQRHRDDDTYAGALHTPPGAVVAFRTDALYLTQPQHWSYHHQPGDYLLRGHLTGPLAAPTSEEELLTLRDAGRTALTTSQEP